MEFITKSGVRFLIDEEDLHLIKGFNLHLEGQGYLRAFKMVGGKKFRKRLHQIIMNTPKGMCTDHINGDRLDNRKSNLRICSSGENGKNRSAHKVLGKSSKYKGVSADKRGLKTGKIWIAQIMVDGKAKHLGTFCEESAAAEAYNIAASLYFGAFARLNDITKEFVRE